MNDVTTAEWRLLLRILLAQRLEINALEGALTTAGVITDAHLKEIRTQAADTARAWSSDDSDDILTLIKIHALPAASMRIPPPKE